MIFAYWVTEATDTH